MKAWKAAVATAALAVLLAADLAALGGLRSACGCQEQGMRSCSGGVCCVLRSPCRARHHTPEAVPGHGHASAAVKASAKLCGCALRSGASESSEAAVAQPRMHEGLLAGAIGVPQPIPERPLTPPEITLPASFVLTPEAPPPRPAV